MVKIGSRILLLTIVTAMFLMPGCDHRNAGEIIMNGDSNIQNSKIEPVMYIAQPVHSISTERVVVTIKNSLSTNIYSGLDYSIEYYDGATLTKAPIEITYFLSLATILPQESKDFCIYLYPEQYNYLPGKYLVRKSISTTKHADVPNCTIYDLTAEFNIE